MANHDCTNSGCNGYAYFGISLTCQCCFKPSFLECIQTRKEISDLLDAIGLSGSSKPTTIPEQQQLINKIKNSLFTPNSVFEFVCVRCKANGNRFITAAEQQNEQSSKLREISIELAEMKKMYNESNSKLSREVENANQLAAKIKQMDTQLKLYADTIQQLNAEIERVKIVNNELNSKVNNYNSNTNGIGAAAMDTDQSSSSVFESYNASICASINSSLSEMCTRLENRMAIQYRDVFDAITVGDPRKRKAPGNTNSLNIDASSFTPQTPTVTAPLANSTNELEPPEEKIVPKPFRSIYQIYVSKFKNNTTTEKIINHVITKSSCKNRDSFSVELMVGPKENVHKLSYVSFKITTCSENVYEAILKEEVWAPSFTATPFSPQNHHTKNTAKYNKNGKKQNSSKSQTPARMNPSHRNERQASGDSSHQRRVTFEENNRTSNANQQNTTPRSSRSNRTNSSGNKTPISITPAGKQSNVSTSAAQMQRNVMQHPAFFGMPGQPYNVMQPLYYPLQQQQMFQQPQTFHQQQQAPNLQRQRQYQQQQMQQL